MIKLPSYLTGFSSKTDGSASIRFATQELSAEEFGDLKKSLNAFGWLMFSENEIREDEIPDDDADESKTPAQRQRAVLFLNWKQEGSKGEFNSYYREKMEKLINYLKEKLD